MSLKNDAHCYGRVEGSASIFVCSCDSNFERGAAWNIHVLEVFRIDSLKCVHLQQKKEYV